MVLTVNESIPKLCDVHDLMRIFGVSRSTIYDWDRQGKLSRFEVRRPLGTRKWSGALLQEHANGQTTALRLATAS